MSVGASGTIVHRDRERLVEAQAAAVGRADEQFHGGRGFEVERLAVLQLQRRADDLELAGRIALQRVGEGVALVGIDRRQRADAPRRLDSRRSRRWKEGCSSAG